MSGKPCVTKLVLVGPTGVGKTSIVTRYNGGGFSAHLSPTIGASFCRAEMQVGSINLLIQIWDTAGQERFRAMAPMYYRNTDAALIVYDITNRDSFDAVKSWIDELNRNIDKPFAMCIVGNKRDLDPLRAVPTEVAKRLAESSNALFFETSALTGFGLENVFSETAERMCDLILKRGEFGHRDSVAVDNQTASSVWRKCC
ncbi:Ras domain containing protein [Trichuris trichiura]|uniref:Ras domain containing protein n=1 Tax=Trichuris trichiura TaxID=36087 RepID=A0A077ZFI5_TRITR|nr:Ras domain containing protein [Trichuris trichiura]